MSKPTSWARYHLKVSQANNIIHPSLNIFATRFMLAKNFPDFQFRDFSRSTSDAYQIALRVSLSYTALESLEGAIGCPNQISITSSTLVTVFRSDLFKGFFNAILLAKEVEKREKENIKRILSGENDDLRPIVYAIRNLMFHGTLTANALTLTSSVRRRQALDELSTSVLDCVDQRFTLYVSKMK